MKRRKVDQKQLTEWFRGQIRTYGAVGNLYFLKLRYMHICYSYFTRIINTCTVIKPKKKTINPCLNLRTSTLIIRKAFSLFPVFGKKRFGMAFFARGKCKNLLFIVTNVPRKVSGLKWKQSPCFPSTFTLFRPRDYYLKMKRERSFFVSFVPWFCISMNCWNFHATRLI